MTPPDRNNVPRLLRPLYSTYAKITNCAVQVTNIRCMPPTKMGSEINLLIIEMAIKKRGPILFLRIIQIKATRFRAAKTAAFPTTNYSFFPT